MENNQNNDLTVWQRLSKAFGPNSLLNQDYPVYQLDKKELLKTTSKAEYEKNYRHNKLIILPINGLKLKVIYILKRYIMNQLV